MILLRQYGLQRSGTNITKALVEINFKSVYVVTAFLGSKHEPMSWELLEKNLESQDPQVVQFPEEYVPLLENSIRSRSLGFIFNIKDPVSWLESYYRYQRIKFRNKNPGKELNFSDKFVTRSLAAWDANIRSWLRFAIENAQQCVVVQHEHVINDGLRVIEQMGKTFGLEPKNEFLKSELEEYALRGTEAQHGDSVLHQKKKFDRSYHRTGKWIKHIPQRHITRALDCLSVFVESETDLAGFLDISHLPESFQSQVFRRK